MLWASMVARVWRGAPGPRLPCPPGYRRGCGCAAVAGFMTGSHGGVFSCVFAAPEGSCQGQMQASVAQGLTPTLRRQTEARGVGTVCLARGMAPGAPVTVGTSPVLRFSGFSVTRKPSVTPCGCWGAWGGSPRGTALPCRWEAAAVSALGLRAERAPRLGTRASCPCFCPWNWISNRAFLGCRGPCKRGQRSLWSTEVAPSCARQGHATFRPVEEY